MRNNTEQRCSPPFWIRDVKQVKRLAHNGWGLNGSNYICVRVFGGLFDGARGTRGGDARIWLRQRLQRGKMAKGWERETQISGNALFTLYFSDTQK